MAWQVWYMLAMLECAGTVKNDDLDVKGKLTTED